MEWLCITGDMPIKEYDLDEADFHVRSLVCDFVCVPADDVRTHMELWTRASYSNLCDGWPGRLHVEYVQVYFRERKDVAEYGQI